MTLAELVRAMGPGSVAGDANLRITGLAHDSRAARPGDAFFALPGARTDGNRHARQALERGAVAVVSELAPPPAPAALPAVWVQVPDAALALARAADAFYRAPSAALTTIGVTGTNGKTTTTYLMESIAHALGARAGVIGTVEHRLRSVFIEKAANTTPPALELTRLLARLRDAGATHALMEVSSHALALKRVEAVRFDAAVFLNLTRDHLDFHKSPEAYFEAKARLFDLLARADNPKAPKIAALNADDPRSAALARRAIDCEVVRFSASGAPAELSARVESASLDGSRLIVNWHGRSAPAFLRLPGPYNVSNALAALAPLLGLGAPLERALEGVSALASVPGRLERIDEGQDFRVFVDFAHTDSALEGVLALLRGLKPRRLITVFGCGGDRDRTKRGPMGAAACRGSDMVFATSDNPRTEDPAAILADIEAGIRAEGFQNYRIVPDRSHAVSAAIREARGGDVVLIAGKGHEQGQILRDRTVAFDDREAARAALRALK